MAGRVRHKVSGNLLPFPGFDYTLEPEIADEPKPKNSELQIAGAPTRPRLIGGVDELDVVLCGTYRKDIEGLRRSFEQLKDLGFNVLSPSNLEIVKETNGFV